MSPQWGLLGLVRVWGLGFRVQGLGFMIYGFGFWGWLVRRIGPLRIGSMEVWKVRVRGLDGPPKGELPRLQRSVFPIMVWGGGGSQTLNPKPSAPKL